MPPAPSPKTQSTSPVSSHAETPHRQWSLQSDIKSASPKSTSFHQRHRQPGRRHVQERPSGSSSSSTQPSASACSLDKTLVPASHIWQDSEKFIRTSFL